MLNILDNTMKNKFLIIGDIYPSSWKDAYIIAAKSNGDEADFIDVSMIRIDIEQGNISIIGNENPITSYTDIIFLSEVYERLYYYLCYLLQNSPVRILNSKSLLKYPTLSDKFLQTLISNKVGIATPRTSYALNPLLIQDVYQYPLILKTLGASHSSHSGRGVIKIFTKKHLDYTYATNIEGGLKAQEFLEINPVHDFRTIILNGKSLGTIKKLPPEGEFRTNGPKEVIHVPDNPKHIELLLKLANEIECDLFAPDYIIREDKMIIFEINRFPSFSAFGSSVASEVIKYMTQEFNLSESGVKN